jgi:hypothetical protein
MSDTLGMRTVIAAEPSLSKVAEDHDTVLIFCGIGLLVSLVALLLAPEWVFQPQTIASVGLP